MRARTALVSGGNRGIGLEICRQLGARGLRIVLGARDLRLGRQAAGELRAAGIAVRVEQLDVADERSVQACVRRLGRARIAVDVLVNNAGVYEHGTLLRLQTEALRRSLDTHLLGPWWLARALMPGMQRRAYGRIVNLSSEYGSFAHGLGGAPAYAISKAALNALTLRLAQEAGPGVKVNSVCPGWVRTRIGGPEAPRDVAQGARTPVWLATLPEKGPNGGFFRDRRRFSW